MAYVGEALVAELALMGRGRRPLDPTPNPTSDSDPPAAPHRIVWPLTESCAPSQNRCIRMAHGDPAQSPPDPVQSPSPEKVTTRQKGGAGRNRPRPKSEVSLRGSLWRLAGREIGFSLGGGGVKRGVAMSHDIL